MQAWAYRDIAEAQARRGDVAGVEAWAEFELDPKLRASILLGALEGLLPEDKAAGD